MTPRMPRDAFALVAAAALFSGAAIGQTSAPPQPDSGEKGAASAPTPDFTFSSNVGIFSQYVFRGVSQTNEKPAVQGGFDLAHKSGLYVGTWLSNISWLSDASPNVSASLEWDIYGGYKGTLYGDFGYDVGLLYYYYPGRFPGAGYTKPDTLEGYVGLTWKFLSLKYSNSLDKKTFGVPSSRGSDYIDLTGNYDVIEKVNDAIGKVTLTGHVGHQRYRGTTHDINLGELHNGDLSYTDWKLGVSTDVYGVTAGFFVTGTDADKNLYTNPFGKKIADTQYVVYVQKTF